MPQLDGIGVLRQVNKMDMKKKPYIIMLSAAGKSETIESCLDLGAQFFVEKPLDMNALISRLIQIKNTGYN